MSSRERAIKRVEEMPKKAARLRNIKYIRHSECIVSKFLREAEEEVIISLSNSLGGEAQSPSSYTLNNNQKKILKEWPLSDAIRIHLVHQGVNIGTAINMKLSIAIAKNS